MLIVTHPWLSPSANAELAELATASTPLPETSTVRLWEVEEVVRWTHRERLRLLWYQIRLATGGISGGSRRARERPLKLP
jgi:uncharacterized SAM-binding protein YcdF (DUF218 family)